MVPCNSDKPTEYRNIPAIIECLPTVGYQAGKDGTIWSSWARGGTRLDNGIRYKRLKGCRNADGYVVTTLTINGQVYHFLVHRLILLTFIGPCPNGLESCHINGVPDDNRIENLRYDTHLSNIHDKFKHGTVHRGEQIVQSKLTEVDILRIRKLADLGVPGSIIAEVFGVQKPQICRILKGERWNHI